MAPQTSLPPHEDRQPDHTVLVAVSPPTQEIPNGEIRQKLPGIFLKKWWKKLYLCYKFTPDFGLVSIHSPGDDDAANAA